MSQCKAFCSYMWLEFCIPRRKRQLLMQALLHFFFGLIYTSTGSKSRCLMLLLAGSSKTGQLGEGRQDGVEVTGGQWPCQPGMLSHNAQARGAEHVQQLWPDPDSRPDRWRSPQWWGKRLRQQSKGQISKVQGHLFALLFCQGSARLFLNLPHKECFACVG